MDMKNNLAGALKRLEKHPYVTRISIDHAVNGSTYTSARAIGANLVWAGSTGMPEMRYLQERAHD
jgi:pentose-5-phosphate-3-epimerase